MRLPFYEYRLYQPDSSVYLMLISLDRDVLSSIRRITVVDEILQQTTQFEKNIIWNYIIPAYPISAIFNLLLFQRK